MKYLLWLLKAAIFLILFAFALNNRHAVELYVLPGYTMHLPVVVVILASLALGILLGMMVMVPRWWRHRRLAQKARAEAQEIRQTVSGTAVAAAQPSTGQTPPAELPRHMTDPSIPL